MKDYRVVAVSEQQLEDLVRQAPDKIEEGLRFLTHQRSLEQGRLDVLMVDRGNALVVAELKVAPDDGMLIQCLDYYDQTVRNIDTYGRLYKVDPEQEPRLMLIAPTFPVTLLNRVKWIDVRVSLYTFKCIELADHPGEIVAIYDEVKAPDLPNKPTAYSVPDRLGYITDPEARRLAEQVIDEAKSWDKERVSADATKYDVSLKISGRVFAYLAPRRSFFLVYRHDKDGEWLPLEVRKSEDLRTVLQATRENFDRKRTLKN
jgi:hypothetical protein